MPQESVGGNDLGQFSPSSASQVSDNDRISTNYLFNVPVFRSLTANRLNLPLISLPEERFCPSEVNFQNAIFGSGAGRQLAFRRTNTDLCAESVHRLVGYHSIGDSPHPQPAKTQLRRGNADAQHQAIAAATSSSQNSPEVAPVQQSLKPPSSFLPPTSGGERKGSKISHSKPRRIQFTDGERSAAPLIPPDGRQQMDDSAMRKCIDELRRRGLYPNKSNQIILRSQPDQLLVPMTKRDALQERFSVPNMPTDLLLRTVMARTGAG
uniref:Uncharacterized protein n=1 Tax=Ditylenchus dipsaci TaxID=166011 RepID=A0A915CV46_9BILA